MRLRLASALAAVMLAAPIAATPRPDAKLALLQQRDARLFAIGWRLASANAGFCEGAAPALGLAVLDVGGFRKSARIRQQLGLAGDIGIGAVAPGSPAAAAGISANDTLLAIAGEAIAVRFPLAKPTWQRLIDVTAALDAVATRGPVTLTLARGKAPPRTLTLDPVPACPSRFEVLSSGGKAMAEGTRVIFGRDFVGFDYPDELFAAAVAHEFAHNLLGHRKRLDASGRSLGNQRLSEREADRLMPWLLANAGYDPAAAIRFMARWGPRHDGGLFRNRDHEGWDERADAIRAEVGKVEAALTRDGHVDWSTHFVREAFGQAS